jgi:hypothetical protein
MTPFIKSLFSSIEVRREKNRFILIETNLYSHMPIYGGKKKKRPTLYFNKSIKKIKKT